MKVKGMNKKRFFGFSLAFLLVGFSLLLFGSSSISSYTPIGGGVCNCSSCDDCNNALNDNINCQNEVRLTANITNQVGTCINSPENFENKTFDCQDHKLDGNSANEDWPDAGIYLNGKKGNFIENCIITEFREGIYLNDSANNNIFLSNTVNDNAGDGFYLNFSSNNTFINNTANNNWIGFYLRFSSNTTLINNTANSNDRYGFSFYQSSNNSLINNTANNNSWHGITIGYGSLNIALNSNTFCNNNQSGESNYDIFDSYASFGYGNTCDTAYNHNDTGYIGCSWLCNGSEGNKISAYATCGCTTGIYNYTCGETINESCTLTCNLNSNGTCFTIGANDIVIDGAGYSITGNNSGYGIDVTGRTNITVKNFKIYNFRHGIYLSSSSNNNMITNNNASNNSGSGIRLSSSSNNNMITNNTANNNGAGGHGISLYFSSNNNIIADNTANNNRNNGILLYSSSNNTLTNNNLNNNTWGIYLSSSSNNNTLINNTANNNTHHGIWLSSSSNNNITNNNITNNNDTGVYFSSDSNNNNLGKNFICWNNLVDVNDTDANSGDENTCDKTQNWDDNGTTKCTYTCTTLQDDICYCSSCSDCEERLNDPLCNEVHLDADIENYSGTCITTQENNKTFNCNSYSINSQNSSTNYGIDVQHNFTTIESCNISGFYLGIRTRYVINTTIRSNILYNNTGGGISLSYSNFSLIMNNIISENGNNSISHYGLRLWEVYNSTIYNNTIYNNTGAGIYCYKSNYNTISSNRVFNNSNMGILSSTSNYNTILNNSFHDNTNRGLYFSTSSNLNEILNNMVYNNSNDGILVQQYSQNNSFINNTITGNAGDGIYLTSSAGNNSIFGNFICGNDNNDIRNSATDNFGTENYCDTTNGVFGWNDTGIVGGGCTHSCTQQSAVESFIIFLHQGWNLISFPLNL
jgi:parallel beta-helix repeat protein